jgi:uncharacterized protein YabE (DUF348 family)
VRSRLAQLSRSKTVLATLAALVVAAVGGTTVGYAALSKDVTLTLDGQTRQVSAIGATVGDVLEAEGVSVTDKDLVAPAVDESVTDGTAIAVQFGRPLELSVDGDARTYWVNSTDVASALSEIGRRFDGADLSTSRSSSIGRTGLSLKVVTPKVVRIKLGALPVRRTGPSKEAGGPPLSSSDIANAWRAYFDVCMELFGADNCMFESNFPVPKRWGS